MEIKKIKNYMNCYDYLFIDNNKTLKIFYAGNLDLYMTLSDGNIIDYEKDLNLYFDITKENYNVFELFDETYNYILEGKPFADYSYDEFDSFSNFNYKNTYQYQNLINNNNIVWISDNGPRDCEDKLIINKYDDFYRLNFIRNDKPLDFGFKSPFCISVRFRNSGSFYAPFNCVFMNMYNKLNNLDLENHQIHFEEIEYQKKYKKKVY